MVGLALSQAATLRSAAKSFDECRTIEAGTYGGDLTVCSHGTFTPMVAGYAMTLPWWCITRPP